MQAGKPKRQLIREKEYARGVENWSWRNKLQVSAKWDKEKVQITLVSITCIY
jgi:hypothetical protein